MALLICMRLSSRRSAHGVVASSAEVGNPGHPDFLSRPAALGICMRLSLRRSAHVSWLAARSRKSGSPGFPVETCGFGGSACGSLYGEPHTWTSLAARSRKSGYASVEMTRGRVVMARSRRSWDRQTADLSTALPRISCRKPQVSTGNPGKRSFQSHRTRIRCR